jgi:hypothetical protein
MVKNTDVKPLNYDDPTKLFVTGPINAVRVEGTINNIKKVLYLFMDWHEDIHYQTECIDINSIDFVQYFVNQIKQADDKHIDFFMETYLETIENTKPHNKNTKYIWKIQNFFNKKVEKSGNKVLPSKFSKNEKADVKMHYIDIRAKLYRHSNDLLMSIRNTNMYSFFNKEVVNEFKKLYSDLSDDITKNYNLLIDSKIDSKKYDKEILNIIKKLKTYKYKENKVIYDYWVDMITAVYKQIIALINEIIAIIDKFNDKIADNELKLFSYNIGESYFFSYRDANTLPSDIMNITNNISTLVSKFYSYFVDIYAMRRFIDKDYVSNAISYTGAMHSIRYIDILVKKYGFKVTHTSFRFEKDLDKLDKIIKKGSEFQVSGLFFPDVLIQCSDLTDFPEGFA